MPETGMITLSERRATRARILFFLLALLPPVLSAAEWVVTKGGKSPDGKWAVAVYPHPSEKPGSNEYVEVNGTVLLIDRAKGRKIGPLEEVDSSGGTWGTTTTNVECQWSADSRVLLVNFRTGRLMNAFQIYHITGRRAVPVSMPDPASHPKGKIMEILESSNNPGAWVTMTRKGGIIVDKYGWNVKTGHWEDCAKYGLKDFSGSLRLHHRFDKQGRLRLVDVTLPPDP